MHHPFAILCLAGLAIAPLAAQDFIGIDFSGTTYLADSHTGVGQQFATNAMRCNSMARKGSDLWVDTATGPTLSPVRGLGRLDEQTGVVTIVFPNLGLDLRGLATTNTFGKILGIVNDTPSDRLVQIDVNSGAIVNLGSTGFTSIQALGLLPGQFYAWDTTAGLLRVNHLTGAATDVNPSLGTGGADIQFLCAMHDGRLIGGRSQLFVIDPNTGVATLIGGSGYSDLRGGDERFGYIVSYGAACHAQGGTPTLTVTGAISAPTTLQTRSINHQPGAPGFLCFGFSDSQAGALHLPFNVDPLLGTNGCRVLQSCDITLFGTADFLGRLTVSMPFPPQVHGAFLFFQHATIEPVQGGWSFSNGVRVSLSL